jgi:hypothetical protein
MTRRTNELCVECGAARNCHTPLNRATGLCCDGFTAAVKRVLAKDTEYWDAWGGSTEDRSTYNLGDGCRRVPSRGGQD